MQQAEHGDAVDRAHENLAILEACAAATSPMS
jgi:hypothetical protein